MLYPSPYRAGMSSLGYQWISHLLAEAGFGVERAFLPDDLEQWKKSRRPLITYETETPLGNFEIIAVSLAYELELAGLVQCLELAGIPPLRRDRGSDHPQILIGGPLTFSNPRTAFPFADAVLLGEADDVVVPAVEAFFESEREVWLDQVEGLAGGLVPERGDQAFAWGSSLPPIAKASDRTLPAVSRILAPEAALTDMLLIEGERGCHRQCTFCVMRRSTNGGMRLVSPEHLLSLIPDEARRVGLVGAAISDHPKLVDLLDEIVSSGREIGISSLRADRVALKPRIASLLRKGGYQTLTVASDAASQRLRRQIAKGTIERHLTACAEIARAEQYRVLKIYMMVGVPGETDEDIDELIDFTKQLAAIHPVALGIAPFCPKVNTPLDHASFAGISTVNHRLRRLQKGLQGKAEVRPTSAKWAWVEYKLAIGGPETGEAVLEAVRSGGRFSDYKRVLGAIEDPRPPEA